MGEPLPSPPHVLFVTQSMGGGGAERALVTLLQFLDRSRFVPSLALFSRRGSFLGAVPADVITHDLGERDSYDWLRPTLGLRRRIEVDSPSLVVSFLRHSNLISLAAAWSSRKRPPVLVVEQGSLSLALAASRASWMKLRLHKWLYPRAASIVAVSRGIGNELQEQVGSGLMSPLVIPNPCDQGLIGRLASEEPDRRVNWSRPTIVAVGRLEPVKGFDSLLRAFAQVRAEPVCQLLVLGEGSQEAALLEAAQRLGVSDRVELLGFRPNPFAYIARARVVVVSSVAEAFGNILVEAMTCGTPVVSTDCPHGPRDITQDGACGLLVPPGDPVALAAAIERVLTEPALAVRLSTSGRVRARDFAAEAVTRSYQAEFERVCLETCRG